MFLPADTENIPKISGAKNVLRPSLTYLEPCWAPVHKLDGSLGLDGGDGGVDILGHHVPAVQHAARHVLPCT